MQDYILQHLREGFTVQREEDSERGEVARVQSNGLTS